MNGLRLDIGGEVYSFRTEGLDVPRGRDSTHCFYEAFSSRRRPHVEVSIRRGIPGRYQRGELVHDTDAYWQMRRTGVRGFMGIKALDEPGPLRGVFVLDKTKSRGDLFLGPAEEDPTVFGLVDLVMRQLAVIRLAGSGLLLHSAVLSRRGRGMAFVGNSGAGKSTLARLLMDGGCSGPGWSWLSDDRAIIREVCGRWRVFGTPWHGEARLAAPGSPLLSGLLVLKQAAKNALRPLSRLEAGAALCRCSFAPYWDPQLMAGVLKTCERLPVSVPVQELSFRPDRSVASFLRERGWI